MIIIKSASLFNVFLGDEILFVNILKVGIKLLDLVVNLNKGCATQQILSILLIVFLDWQWERNIFVDEVEVV